MATKAPLVSMPHRPATGLHADGFGPHVALALGAAAAVFLAGTLLDLGVLWIAQRQATPQWEFVAILNTLEAVPRLLLGIALLFAALHARGSTSLIAYRCLGLSLVGVGISGMALGGLLATDYFPLSRLAQGEALAALRSTTFKGLALAGLYGVALVPVGFLAMRRPRGR